MPERHPLGGMLPAPSGLGCCSTFTKMKSWRQWSLTETQKKQILQVENIIILHKSKTNTRKVSYP